MKLVLIMMALLIPSLCWAQSDPPEWTSCQESADCVVTTGRCSFDMAVNKQHLQEASSEATQWESCDKTGTPDPDALAKCVNNTCVIDGKN